MYIYTTCSILIYFNLRKKVKFIDKNYECFCTQISGHMLWIGDENFLKKTWNIYRVLALPDFDGDGIPEVLISNGGDPSKDPKVRFHNL